jgi:PIN domain nuclease of toxin-antitoxin system
VGIKLLLDTHALVWWWTDDRRLPQLARAVIAEPANTVLISAVSAWEIATKYRVGKWPEVKAIVDGFQAFVLRSRFGLLPMTPAHSLVAGCLDGPHRDPFDRMLIAQAREDHACIVSADPVFGKYGETVIWDGPENSVRA